MAEKVKFAGLMGALSVNFNRALTDEVIDLYWEALADIPDDSLEKAVRLVLQKEEFFPPIAVILKYVKTERPVLEQGAEVFAKILNDYVSGDHISPREVASRYGLAARSSFSAAGGVMAFEHCGTEETAKWVRKAFLDTWKDAVEANPQLALPGPGDQAPSEGEAQGALKQILKRMP